jgi:hypothetical protein
MIVIIKTVGPKKEKRKKKKGKKCLFRKIFTELPTHLCKLFTLFLNKQEMSGFPIGGSALIFRVMTPCSLVCGGISITE